MYTRAGRRTTALTVSGNDLKLRHKLETAEAVVLFNPRVITPLKRGVNEREPSNMGGRMFVLLLHLQLVIDGRFINAGAGSRRDGPMPSDEIQRATIQDGKPGRLRDLDCFD